MAKIRAFKAVRPAHDKVHLVVTRSYITYDHEQLEERLKRNPFSFIHIINPEFGKEKKTAVNSDERFINVRDRYHEFREEGIFLKDEEACFYIYRQINEEGSYTGLIAGVSVDDYLNRDVCVHEHTLKVREETFERYLKITGFNAEPVLLTFEDKHQLAEALHSYEDRLPLYDFTTTDRVRHQLWKVDDEEEQELFKARFQNVEKLFIADGHHRCASSALLAKHMREQQNIPEDHPANYFMAYVIPSKELSIHPFHRLIKDVDLPLDQKLFSKIKEHFQVEENYDPGGRIPPGEYGMYYKHEWFKLKPKSKSHGLTDSSVLTREFLDPILGIKDLRHDERVEFYGGEHCRDILESKVDSGEFQMAIALAAVETSELINFSLEGKTMPPKSTYIEPKLRSGLTIFELND